MNKLLLVAAIIPAFLAGCAQPAPLTPFQEQMVMEIEQAPPRSLIFFQDSEEFAIVCGRASERQMKLAMDRKVGMSHGCVGAGAHTTAADFVRSYNVQGVSLPGSPNYDGAIERIIMARYDVPDK